MTKEFNIAHLFKDKWEIEGICPLIKMAITKYRLGLIMEINNPVI